MPSSKITIESLGGTSPVQAEGTVADGRHFYFRARHDAWELHLGDTEEHAVSEPTWSWREPWGDTPYAAGEMAAETAREIIESCGEMIAADILPPRAYYGTPEDAQAAHLLADAIVADICGYHSDAIVAGGSGGRVSVGREIDEGRAFFRSKTDERLHEIYEVALGQIDAWAKGSVAHDVWLMDEHSARSVGRRWVSMILTAPPSRRGVLKATAVRWLTAWTPAGKVREAWETELRSATTSPL